MTTEINRSTTLVRRRSIYVILAISAAALLMTALRYGGGAPYAARADCVYAGPSTQSLAAFERLVGRRFSCVLVYNDAASDWAGWEDPRFVRDSDPALAWGRWASARGVRRQLIVTQNLFPSVLDGSDWLDAGAAGAYEGHARALARNLVAAGLGGAVIRLAHEANDTASADRLGSTAREWGLWRRFWRNTVVAMRSVPGAHFLFDWCVNAYWRPIPLRDWYPGDDVVDIVGIDAYDSGVPVGQDRWTRLYGQRDGIGDVVRFARAHGKPVSIPEWGLAPADAQSLGGGDDPDYIDRIAGVVRREPVAYQAYFFNHDAARLLAGSSRSLAAYRRHFGGGGDLTGTPTITTGH